MAARTARPLHPLAVVDQDPIRVLLVEDDPEDVMLLQDTLAEAHLPKLEWTTVELLADAIDRLARDTFDVVLLDLTLPDSRGLDTFLRLNAARPEAAVVMLTGLHDEDLGLQAVQRGAQDYLVKGYSDPKGLARSLRYSVERSRRQRAERELTARQSEVQAAREIQQRLFPRAAPALPGFDIAGASYPAVETGGDYYDYIPMSDGRLALAIGDVTSHGLGPALVMAETRAYLRALMLSRSNVGEILGLANKALVMDTSDELFVTLLLASLDATSNTLTYASAGHTPGYVLDDAGAVRRELWSTGLPLGVDDDGHFSDGQPLQLNTGDVVLLLTDGITEAADPAGNCFGAERALQTVRANRHRPAPDILAALYHDVRQFQADDQNDDVTAIVVKVGQPLTKPS